MGIIARIRDRFKNKTVSQVQLMSMPGNNFFSWNGTLYKSDIVRACVRPFVKSVGKLVGKHIRKTLTEEGETQIAVNPSFYLRMLLEEPNPIMSGQMLNEKLAAQLILNCNAFALIARNPDGMPMAIYPIDAINVEAYYATANELRMKFTMKNGRIWDFPYADIIHLRNDFVENAIFGTPLAPSLTPLLDVVTITDQGIKSAIKNSSIVRWLLKFTNSLRPDDLKEQTKNFSESFLSTENGVGVAAVDSKADAIQVNPTDYVPNAPVMSQAVERIYALFNTNSKIVNSCANEDEVNAYFDAVIEPVMTQISNEFTRKLFTRRERAFGNKIVFENSAWDTASFKTKLNLVALVDRGGLLVNEWRAAFNLAPIPGGDVAIRRLDTMPVNSSETEGKEDDE